MAFSVPIKKENENDKTITYKIKLVDSLRFMLSSLSILPDNLTEGLHQDECKQNKFRDGDIRKFCLMLRKGV